MDQRDLLRREFEGEPGSFLYRLRGDLVWDRDAFTRVEHAMRGVCVELQGRDVVERWLAEGYFVMAIWVRELTSHPDFPRPAPTTYYEACIQRLSDLAEWFFRGEHAYEEPHEWTDL